MREKTNRESVSEELRATLVKLSTYESQVMHTKFKEK